MSETQRNPRFAKYSDAEILATLDEIAVIEKFGMTAMERQLADEIKAEAALRTPHANDGRGVEGLKAMSSFETPADRRAQASDKSGG